MIIALFFTIGGLLSYFTVKLETKKFEILFALIIIIIGLAIIYKNKWIIRLYSFYFFCFIKMKQKNSNNYDKNTIFCDGYKYIFKNYINFG